MKRHEHSRGNDGTWRARERTVQDLTLVVIGDGLQERHDLTTPGVFTIGRADHCDIVIAHPSVSRRHAVLSTGATITIQDAGSANGVRLHGRSLPPETEASLEVGDAISLGEITLLLQHRATVTPGATMSGEPDGDVVARDPATRDAIALAKKVARGELTVLLIGETGVGKEVFAELVHRGSPRAAGPFMKINCAALAPTLLESELFGHEKGAFTGAAGPQRGLIESANGGTLFLDEVGEMPLPLQAKLLRVLEERVVLPVGARRPRAVDVRFVAATNRDLLAASASGSFREDLYYRLHGITITVPPLRERPDDIEPLTDFFLQRAGRDPASISPAARRALRSHRWPGNVRELRNAIDRAALLAEGGIIDVTDLPAEMRTATIAAKPANTATSVPPPAPAAGPLRSDITAFERERILQALAACAGNQTRAAEMLGIPRRTLVTKLGALEIPRPRKHRDE